MTTGEKVRARREALGLDQKDLAAMIGVTPGMLCQIERGSKALSMPLAQEIARVYDCTLNDLAGD